jgi:hypothetical protein
MRRSTGISAFFSLLRPASAGAIALASVLACSDSTSPAVPKDGIPVQVELIPGTFSDAEKQAWADQFTAALLNPPRAIAANAFASPAKALSSLSASCGSSGSGDEYLVSNIAFNPEEIPIYSPTPITPDKWIPDLPIGFSFTFFGNTYDKVNVYSNGFLKFETPPDGQGFFNGMDIPFPNLPNNIIAFAWADWEPQLVAGGIRFETRGVAPHRRFLIQFNNVPEWKGQGLLMSQLILYEGSNDIVMYTNTVHITNPGNRLTQGIENKDGTKAFVGDPVALANGALSPRVRGFYRLTNDAIKFSLPKVTDTQAPLLIAPADVSDFPNDPTLGTAVVAAIGSPEASDNCAVESITSSRSDGLPSDAPYKVGVTTITWTAKDAAGNTATATQQIEVIDVEAPVITAIPSSFTVNATSSLGTEVSYEFNARDNVAVAALTCDPVLGSRLAIGVNPVTCTASDAAGNKSSGSFEVTVIDAPTQMMNLIQYVISRGMGEGTTNPLVNELQQAFGNVENGGGCKKMSDFQEMVIKKGVRDDWASYMFSESSRIMVVMKCAPTFQLSKKAKPRMG